MRKLAILGLALAAAVVPTALAAKPPKPPAGTTLAVSVHPNPIVFGHYATIAGALSSKSAGVAIELQTDPYPYDGRWLTRGTKSTDAKGQVSFALAPGLNTKIRLRTTGSPRITSNEVPMGVRWSVGLRVSDSTPNAGSNVRFSGSVHPAHVGGTVLIQKRTSTGYKTVKSTLLRAATTRYSTYRVSLRIRTSGRYRVRVPGDAAHLAGTSRSRTLTVG